MDSATAAASLQQHPDFKLTPRQEELLLAALNSTDKKASSTTNTANTANGSFTMAPGALTASPLQQQAPGSGTLGFEESPYIDYDFDFDPEASFDDYGFANDSQQMIGSLPGSAPHDAESNLHDKRGHSEDLDDEDEGGGKRREGDEKQSKKPGRKPLTSEPTTKRKAQNRAAQRAFRERKEKHLKDLETKVEDLEKASESANHENSLLRAQIEKMTAELQEYRKRFSLNGGVNRSSSFNSHALPSYLAGKGLGGISNPNDVSFQFEFPKFGRLPGPPQSNSNPNSTSAMSSPSDLSSPGLGLQQYPSPRNQSVNSISGQPLSQTPAQANGTDMSSLSGLFSPSLLDTVSKSPNYDFFSGSGARTNGSRSSTDSNGNNTSYSSPSASSNGQQGSSSSCGTSPEPSTHSPHISKPVDSSLTTIGEEKIDEGNLFNQNFDFNGIDWLAEQNNNQFDPQLFGDYREPQDNILAGDAFNNDSFFTDAFSLPDFQTPASLEPSPAPAKKDLLAQIDQKQNEDEVVPAEDRSKLLNCNTIWDRLQACPSVKEGEFDLDLLCKDLQKKAKCSESGAVVNESDFNKVLHTYVNNKGNPVAKKV